MTVQLNLLPDVKKEYLKSQRMKRNIMAISIVASIIIVGLVLLLALYVHGAQRIARNQLQGDIDKSSKELAAVKDVDKILTVQGALEALPTLHDQKFANSHFFDYVKVLVPNDVSLTKLDLTHTGNVIKITGRSTDYKSLNVFADTIKSAQLAYGAQDKRTTIAPFKNVTVVTATRSSDPQKPGIEFTLSLAYNPIIFAAKTENPVMSVPSTTTGQGFVKSNELFSGDREADSTKEAQ